jgi:signal transduction histidine kinase
MSRPTGAGGYSELEVEELTERISWLIRLRWVAATGVVVTVAMASKLLGVPLAERQLYAITAGLAVYNAALWTISRRLPPNLHSAHLAAFANLQLGVDLLFLTALLHFSGGIENPFFCYYVFHIVIASILLSRRATYALAAIALGLFSLMVMMEGGGSLAHHHLALVGPSVFYRPIYVNVILFVMGTTLGITAFLATSITARLREREGEVVRLSQSLRQHTDELEESYESLARLERSKSVYLYRVAHHLRSPLAALERVLSVVAEGRTGPLPEKAKEMVERSRQRVRDILDLAHDLLALSRAREATPQKDTTVDLAQIAANVVGDFQQAAAAGSLSLEWEVEPGLAPIVGDPESIAEMFENLISNAVKYTPPGGRIGVKVRRIAGEVEISVSDTGIGIREEDLPSIFEEFYRAENARGSGKEGTGLGLSIVQAIAKAHGGEVSVESKVGEGTTFRVTLSAEGWEQV